MLLLPTSAHGHGGGGGGQHQLSLSALNINSSSSAGNVNSHSASFDGGGSNSGGNALLKVNSIGGVGYNGASAGDVRRIGGVAAAGGGGGGGTSDKANKAANRWSGLWGSSAKVSINLDLYYRRKGTILCIL